MRTLLKCGTVVPALTVLFLFGALPGAFVKEKPALVSQQEFLASDFQRFFKKGEFSQALTVLDGLTKKYPEDPLILRYRALTLDKLSRRKDAVAVYQKILRRDPDHVPTHLFLGLTYARDGKPKEAARELRWVVDHSASEDYKHWAQAQLTRVRQKPRKVGKTIKKKPYLVGKSGVSYDSNPLLIPNEDRLSSRPKKDGVDFPFELTVGYPMVLKKDTRVDVLYAGSELLHDGGADQVDFTSQGLALDAKHRRFLGGRGVLLGGRYDFKTNFLRSDLFSVVNRLVLSADTSFWPKTRTHLYGRLSYSNYGPDGSLPSVASRDGFREGIGLVQYFYLEDPRTYFFVKEEVSFSETRGDNFDRTGSLTRLGVRTPLDFWGPVDLDISTGFDWGTYPDFTSLSALDLNEREDRRFDVYTALTYHWKPDLATRVFYRFINSDNDNGFYERDRHIAGVEVVFSL